MNLMESTEEASGEVLFTNFNQDFTSLAVGSKKGFKLYSFNSVENPEVIHEAQGPGDDIRIIERLFSSSLVAIVTISAPRKLKVCHFKKSSEICHYSYSNHILAVKLNRQRLVVCLGESLYIHNIRDMKILHTIRDTPPNELGLIALTVCNGKSYIAYPGSSSVGEVQIFDTDALQAKIMIAAHHNPLAAMAFDPNTGTKLATASVKGTVIRVFNVLDGTKLFEFRRGVKRCVTIYSLSFSADSTFLSASSNTETVHIFRLVQEKEVKPVEEPQGWIGYLGQVVYNSASFLPAQVTDMLYQGRSFASIRLPFSAMRNMCALAMIEKVLHVLVVSADGILYIYDLDTINGGDCNLLASHKICGSLMGDSSERSIIKPNENNLENSPPAQPESPSTRRFQPGSTSYAAIVRGGEAGTAQETNPEGRMDSMSYHAKTLCESEYPNLPKSEKQS